ncbi:hypothetical protein AMS68_000500 [Peltaster fructicola]|uniref:RNA polymerase III RPC4-domain-containing protein n=1 Tax=Peltaster fructicola TaxID=286661 RepID=A0A6H0XJS4_9PEZI|nr:hypothetical protein AMS68_000500 [Peltaster fructicola]
MPPKRPPARGGRSAVSTGTAASQQSTDETPNSAADPEAAQDGVKHDTTEPPRPSSAASIAQHLNPAQSRPSSPASSRGRGGASRPVARPRGIGRRSHKDRAELEKAEQERRQAEAASKAREAAWKQRRDLARNRGSSRGRMRGGYAGDTERRKDSSNLAVSGPFSVGEVSRAKGTRLAPSGVGTSRGSGGGNSIGGIFGGGSSSTSGAGAVKREPGSGTTRYANPEDGGYISSGDENDPDERLNVDNLIDLTLEEDRGLPPVRVMRSEHKGRDLVSATEPTKTTHSTATAAAAADVDKKRGKQRAKDFEITKESHRYKGTYTDSESEGEHQIKAEPVETDDRPVAPEAMQSPPTSPETRRKAKERIKHGTTESDAPRPAFQTKQEELEYDIQQRDLRILRTELGPVALPPSATDTDQAKDAANPEDDPRADKVYLFQLPAVLPTLVPIVPKAEDDDIAMQDVPEVGTAPAESKAKPPVLNGSTAASGLVGKLRVHASGKAYLDWGGIPMEVSMGQEATFLQDVLVLDSRDTKPGAAKETEDDVAGMAMSMGQVKGKFVVVPEWDKIFDEIA